MRVLGLIAGLALAGVAHGSASVALLAPAYTQTPVVPATVVAGQVVTARFGVWSDLPPISWSIGISDLTDTTPSGSWDWVVDEDGAYGVTKTFMKAACPTPGVIITAPTPTNHPILSAFVVPDYGPVPVTMALHVRVRQGPQAYCGADSELYKVFVVMPAWTPTATRTSTRTPTSSPVLTSTPTPTVGGPPPTSTSSPTPGPTTVPTPVPTVGPSTGKVRAVVPVPNPGPTRFSFYVEGVADRATISIYTYGQTKVYEQTVVGPLSGWATAPSPRPGHGGFIVKVSSYVGGLETAKKFAYVYYY